MVGPIDPLPADEEIVKETDVVFLSGSLEAIEKYDFKTGDLIQNTDDGIIYKAVSDGKGGAVLEPSTEPSPTAEFIEAMKTSVLNSDDLAITVEKEEEITEPLAGGKFTRPVLVYHSSAFLGYRVSEYITYLNPANSPAWGAESGRVLTLEKI